MLYRQAKSALFTPVSTPRHVLIFVIAVNLIAFGLVLFTNYILYPPEARGALVVINTVISVVGATPIAWWTGHQMLTNARLAKELQRLVERDRLTDVATRDFFFSQMERHPNRFGTSLMIDIDHFKRVNDTYGHFAGDAVIRRVAAVLKDNLRTGDIVARFGGEEFVVFLDDHDATDGYQVAERIREAIAADKVGLDQVEIAVTVSIGGSLKPALESVETSIKEADAALYRAKASGRNQTVFDAAPIAA